MSTIEVNKLSKYYGDVCALRDISLRLEENKIYGLLGRNGAGKTTLLELITNRRFPTSGEVTIDGKSVRENDDAIGRIFCMTEQNLYPEGMTIARLFRWTAEFYPTFNTDYALELAKKFELPLRKKMKSLSTGYTSIAKLIVTLASGAPILIFDEPVLGLDAHHRDLFYRELLSGYMEQPRTVILSTHIIEEISDLLERVIILRDHEIAVDDSVENLLRSGYSVSGAEEAVHAFIRGRRCLNIDRMASFASAALLGTLSEEDRSRAAELGLELGALELQKLFIYLTNEEAA